MVLPVSATLLIAIMPWRVAVSALGVLGFVAAVAIFLAMPRFAPEAAARGDSETRRPCRDKPPRRGFPLLLTIGMIDSATRSGFLIFLPFILIGKGASLQTVGFAFTLVFVGGAAGKLVCAHIGARIGVIATVFVDRGVDRGRHAGASCRADRSRAAAAAADRHRAQRHVVGALWLGAGVHRFGRPGARLRHFLHRHARRRCSGPILFGMIGDRVGIPAALMIDAALVLATLPAAWLLRPAFQRDRRTEHSPVKVENELR